MFNKKIKLTAYTWENDIFINEKPTYNKPDQAEWLRLLKPTNKHFNEHQNYYYDVPSARLCPGINNYLNGGIKVKAWTSIRARIHPNGLVERLKGVEESGSNPLIVQHTRDQYEYIYQNNKTAFKLVNPWLFKCSENIKFLFTESHYSTNILREQNLIVAPAIIDYKYQYSTNIHIIADIKKEPYEIIIPYGTPLGTFFPLTEREIKFDCKLIHREEYDKMHSLFPRCPMRKYYQLIKNIKG